MIPRFSPDYRWRDLARCFLPTGAENVGLLERRFAEKAGHAEGVAFKYGRAGLYYLLKALGHRDQTVLMPTYTCVVVAHAVVLSGNQPVFLDNAPGRFQPDPAQYLQALAQDPENTAMVIPTHLFGVAEETADLYQAIRERYPHVFVLQDCAHGYFGQDSAGEHVTTYGDGALFGMNISKLVNSVRGGMLTLRDAELAQRVRQEWQQERQAHGVRPPGMALRARLYALAAGLAFTPLGYEAVYALTRHTALLSGETDYYREDAIDLPADFREPMSAFEAGIGLASLARYEERIAWRRHLAQEYATRLRPLREAGLLHFVEPKPGDTWSHFPVTVPAEKREGILAALEQGLRAEIGRIVDYSVADLAAYRHRGHDPQPQAMATVPAILNLPLTFYEVGLGRWPAEKAVRHKLDRAVAILEQALNAKTTG